MAKCTAQAFIFSGRPDPTWFVGNQHSRRLEAMWNQLESLDTPQSSTRKLGYSGVSITYPSNIEYFAFEMYVQKKVGNRYEWRRDEDRDFERYLLSTAPQGYIPNEIIDSLM